ncbi:hypothetical protein BCV70DRAFT_68498 [Testicularia cyperi]|uniref:Uncharacterized protein n=1 Tax=Testicularia cyperi TaxID=1882483 RepID=A0A317XGU1_9BASI|nr:hypothetical protein BCV70DRAFT_68498 [Testicularia cyperi]
MREEDQGCTDVGRAKARCVTGTDVTRIGCKIVKAIESRMASGLSNQNLAVSLVHSQIYRRGMRWRSGFVIGKRAVNGLRSRMLKAGRIAKGKGLRKGLMMVTRWGRRGQQGNNNFDDRERGTTQDGTSENGEQHPRALSTLYTLTNTAL